MIRFFTKTFKFLYFRHPEFISGKKTDKVVILNLFQDLCKMAYQIMLKQVRNDDQDRLSDRLLNNHDRFRNKFGMTYINIFYVLFVIFSGTSILSAQNLNTNRIFYGQSVDAVTARSLGLGGAGLAAGDAFMAATHNPALAINSDGVLSFNAGTRLYNLEEDRAFPYYDNFEGFVDYGSYYFQSNWYGSYYGQLVYAPDFTDLMNLHISTGFMPFMDFNYDYFEEVRSTGFDDGLLAYNIIENEGMLSLVPLNIALQPLENLSVGVGVGLLTGDVTYYEHIESKNLALSEIDTTINVNNELDGNPVLLSAGFNYQVNERLTLGATFRSAYTVKTKASLKYGAVTDTTGLGRSVDYPERIGVGFDYRFENILAARLMVDYYYEFWSDFKDSWNEDINFDDTYNIRVGVEHIFFDDIPFRAGFNYGTMREDKSLTRTVLSVGSGYVFKGVKIDFAGGFAQNEYYQKDMYSDNLFALEIRQQPVFPFQTGNSDTDRVAWTEYFVRVDLSYSF